MIIFVFLNGNKKDISNLEDILDTVTVDLPKDIPLKADKGYQSKKIKKSHS